MDRKTSCLIIGIDPGQSGGIALIEYHNPSHAITYKMPDTVRGMIDVIQNAPRKMGYTQVQAIYIERVHAMPGQGVSSSFKFGRNLGIVEAIAQTINAPLHWVRPATWQKSLGCLTKGDKRITKIKAQELFPQIKVTHAIADALLIALYGYKDQSRGNE